MSTLIVLSMIQNLQELTGYFRERGAISPETAIKFDKTEFQKQAKTFLKLPFDISTIGYIKSTTEGKYYLDEEALQRYSQKNKRIGILIIVGGIVFFIIFLILSRVLS